MISIYGFDIKHGLGNRWKCTRGAAAEDNDIPVPQWHRDILRERLISSGDGEAESWKALKKRLDGRSRG